MSFELTLLVLPRCSYDSGEHAQEVVCTRQLIALPVSAPHTIVRSQRVTRADLPTTEH